MAPKHYATRVLCIIPARSGSKGIPRKNIRKLGGKPLIHYACHAALSSRYIDRAIVSTDCPNIAACAGETGVDIPFMRPSELARDETPTLDVVRHALHWISQHDDDPFEVIVLLQPTAPFRRAEHVDEAIELLLESAADSVVSVSAVPAHFHPDWQLRIDGGLLRPWSWDTLAEIPTRRQQLTASYTRNGAIYAFRREAFQRCESFYGPRCVAYVMHEEISVNIDTEADWQLAEAYLRQLETRKNAAA